MLHIFGLPDSNERGLCEATTDVREHLFQRPGTDDRAEDIEHRDVPVADTMQ